MAALKKILFLIFVFINVYLSAQNYQFKNFSVDNGITQPYAYTIIQDKNGYLWIGTGEGFCKYDGIKFKTYYTKEGLADNFVTTSYKDKNRNIWIGHNQGNVTFFDGKIFKPINTSGFANSPVTSIISDEKGFIWCATQNDGVFRIGKNFEVDVFKLEFDQDNIFSIAINGQNTLLAGTAQGIKVFELQGENRKPKFISIIEDIPETKINCITKKNNSTSYWVGTQDEGLFLLTPINGKNKTFKTTSIYSNNKKLLDNIQCIYEDKLSNIWIATFSNGVVKLILSPNSLDYSEHQHFTEANGLPTKHIKTIYADHEGNIWIGTYGAGAVMVSDNFFTFYSHQQKEYSNNVTSICIKNNVKWFGTENGLLKIDLNTKEKWFFYNAKNKFITEKITSIYIQDSSTLVVGTEKSGAYMMNTAKQSFTKIFLSNDDLSDHINHITGYGNLIFIATKNGIFKLNPDKKMTTHFTTENGLTHNNINQLLLDSENNLWVVTHSNFITHINKNDEIENIKVYDGNELINITGMIMDAKNNFWLSSFGNGIFVVKNKQDVENITTQNGLKSNYCYAIAIDGSENIWVGHRQGLSRIKTEKNIISRFDKNDGITGDCNYNAFFKEQNGNIWFGTTQGAILFDPHKDKKNLVPPIINVLSIKFNDKEIDSLKNIQLPYDDYKLRIDFIGISFKANSTVLYQYKLEGYDADWSDKTDNQFAQYGKLSEGEYTFLIRAFNNDDVSNEIPYSIKFSIAKPYWKRAWFIALCILIFFYTLYLIVKIRERNHRVFQAQLQKELNEKTREVIAQKDEIERKNKDITDSIRYAKRIQDALLPGINELKETFEESFIFYQPRDIVSGDFYWYRLFGKKLILACADATGHGVPGAFMSMIGSTLLKDITSRFEVTSPAHALAAMDAEIKLLLHQRDDDMDQTSDSVDLIICEIDIETFFVRICSTKRPVLVSKSGTVLTLKKETGHHGRYETNDIQLSKGDIIYLFTDGYPDQFGGEEGKKLKIANIKSLLDEVQTLPIEKQAMIIDRYFNRWKEGHEQVDDVLFIGVQMS